MTTIFIEQDDQNPRNFHSNGHWPKLQKEENASTTGFVVFKAMDGQEVDFISAPNGSHPFTDMGRDGNNHKFSYDLGSSSEYAGKRFKFGPIKTRSTGRLPEEVPGHNLMPAASTSLTIDT